MFVYDQQAKLIVNSQQKPNLVNQAQQEPLIQPEMYDNAVDELTHSDPLSMPVMTWDEPKKESKYSGQGTQHNETKEEPLLMPMMKW